MSETKQTIDDKAKEMRREYMWEYRRQNRDKVAVWNKTYWQRKAEKAEREKVQA